MTGLAYLFTIGSNIWNCLKISHHINLFTCNVSTQHTSLTYPSNRNQVGIRETWWWHIEISSKNYKILCNNTLVLSLNDNSDSNLTQQFLWSVAWSVESPDSGSKTYTEDSTTHTHTHSMSCIEKHSSKLEIQQKNMSTRATVLVKADLTNDYNVCSLRIKSDVAHIVHVALAARIICSDKWQTCPLLGCQSVSGITHCCTSSFPLLALFVFLKCHLNVGLMLSDHFSPSNAQDHKNVS